MFTPVWGRFPIWLIFFRWVETTNQLKVETHCTSFLELDHEGSRNTTSKVLDLDLDRCLGDLDPSPELLITVLRRSLIAKMAQTNACWNVTLRRPNRRLNCKSYFRLPHIPKWSEFSLVNCFWDSWGITESDESWCKHIYIWIPMLVVWTQSV